MHPHISLLLLQIFYTSLYGSPCVTPISDRAHKVHTRQIVPREVYKCSSLAINGRRHTSVAADGLVPAMGVSVAALTPHHHHTRRPLCTSRQRLQLLLAARLHLKLQRTTGFRTTLKNTFKRML